MSNESEASLIPMKSPEGTLTTQDYLIRSQLVILGETYQFILSPRLFEIWVDALSDVPPGQLAAAFCQLLKTWKPDYGRKFPVPGDITAILEEAREVLTNSEIERDWIHDLEASVRDYYPDLNRWPKFNPRSEFAVNAAGGVAYLAAATREQLVWAKKAYREAYLLRVAIEKHSQPGGLLSPELRPLLSKIMEKFKS